jgi:hypothetical protein
MRGGDQAEALQLESCRFHGVVVVWSIPAVEPHQGLGHKYTTMVVRHTMRRIQMEQEIRLHTYSATSPRPQNEEAIEVAVCANLL